MSKLIKLVVWVIVIVAIIFVGKAFFGGSVAEAPTQDTLKEMAKDDGASANMQASSDASLAQDMAGVDAQMNGLSADSATVDEGINVQ